MAEGKDIGGCEGKEPNLGPEKYCGGKEIFSEDGGVG